MFSPLDLVGLARETCGKIEQILAAVGMVSLRRFLDKIGRQLLQASGRVDVRQA